VKTILVVDDEPVIREVLAALFASEGYVVRTAADGQAALEAIATERPDLVLSDIAMPRLDGWGMVEGLRLIDASVPIILMSAAQRFRPAADVEFIAKPFDVDVLLALVERALAR
jgi:CheY-like chemotaxis protein